MIIIKSNWDNYPCERQACEIHFRASIQLGNVELYKCPALKEEKSSKSNSNSNHLLIPNAHTTNNLSNIRNMAILGYHQDKIIYKLVQSIINMSKIIDYSNTSKSQASKWSNMLQNNRLTDRQILKRNQTTLATLQQKLKKWQATFKLTQLQSQELF